MLAFDPSGLVLRQGRPAHCPRGAVMVVERLLLFDRLMIEITLGERATTIGDQGRGDCHFVQRPPACLGTFGMPVLDQRSEEHTSELQSLMRISYAVFCFKKKK